MGSLLQRNILRWGSGPKCHKYCVSKDLHTQLNEKTWTTCLTNPYELVIIHT